MGNLEKSLARELRYTKIQHVLFSVLFAAGALTLIAVAPNIFQVLSIFGIGKRGKNNVYIINRAVRRLVDKGYIEFDKNRKFLKLTDKGITQYHLFEMRNFRNTKPKKWDGKWRIVIFDIKEFRKRDRDKLRRILKGAGFYHLQDSAWVYPYDFEDKLILIKSYMKIGKDVLYIIADKIENDKYLREYFQLKSA